MNRLVLPVIEKSLSFQKVIQATSWATSNSFASQFARPLTIWQTCFQQKTDDNTSSSNRRSTTSQQNKLKVSPKITLIGLNKEMSVSSLEDAQKLAKRRDMNLVQVNTFDSKTQRPVYKLLTAAEMLDDNLEGRKSKSKHNLGDSDKSLQKKSNKVLTIGSRISDHDLEPRLKNISKWLGKRHEVRVFIQGSPNDMSSCEKITKTIEDSIKEPQIGKIVQVQKKAAFIKFLIIPVAPVDSPAPTEDISSA